MQDRWLAKTLPVWLSTGMHTLKNLTQAILSDVLTRCQRYATIGTVYQGQLQASLHFSAQNVTCPTNLF